MLGRKVSPLKVPPDGTEFSSISKSLCPTVKWAGDDGGPCMGGGVLFVLWNRNGDSDAYC